MIYHNPLLTKMTIEQKTTGLIVPCLKGFLKPDNEREVTTRRALEDIRETKGKYFTTRTPDELMTVIPEIHFVMEGLLTSIVNARKPTDGYTWTKSVDVLSLRIKDKITNKGCLDKAMALKETTEEIVRDGLNEFTENSVENGRPDPYFRRQYGQVYDMAKYYAASEMIEYFGLKPNPYKAIFDLYKLGATRITPATLVDESHGRKVTKECITVDFPIALEGQKTKLACIVVCKDGEADPILLVHDLEDDHCKRTPLKTINGK